MAQQVVGPTIGPSNAWSGQITVTTAGTAVQGTAGVTNEGGFWIKALVGNSGVAYVGCDGSGDVASTNGFELTAGQIILVPVRSLADAWFDAATNGDKLCWLKA